MCTIRCLIHRRRKAHQSGNRRQPVNPIFPSDAMRYHTERGKLVIFRRKWVNVQSTRNVCRSERENAKPILPSFSEQRFSVG